jgi:hypothetical protein
MINYNLASTIIKQVKIGQKSANYAITQLEILVGNTSNPSARASYKRAIQTIKQYIKDQIK